MKLETSYNKAPITTESRDIGPFTRDLINKRPPEAGLTVRPLHPNSLSGGAGAQTTQSTSGEVTETR